MHGEFLTLDDAKMARSVGNVIRVTDLPSKGFQPLDFRYLAPELMSTPRSLEMVTMLVLGGQGTLVGPVLGAVLITVLPSVVQPLVAYKTLVEGAVLVAVLLYLPGGLAGLVATATRIGRPSSWRRRRPGS